MKLFFGIVLVTIGWNSLVWSQPDQANIGDVQPGQQEAEVVYRPGDHELFIFPTAFTMPAGASYLTDYAVLWLSYAYAVTASTHLSFFTMFPVVAEAMDFFSVGIKQRLFTLSNVTTALWYGHNFKVGFGIIGGTVSIGNFRNHLTINFAAVTDYQEAHGLVAIGGVYSASGLVKVVGEIVLNTVALKDIRGAFAIGVRFQGERLAVDIAGIRPTTDSGRLLLLPYLKATYLLDPGE